VGEKTMLFPHPLLKKTTSSNILTPHSLASESYLPNVPRPITVQNTGGTSGIGSATLQDGETKGALAASQASGVAGTLKAQSFAFSTGISSITGGSVSASSNTSVQIGDAFTVTHPTLSYGTPVSILVSLLVEGSVPNPAFITSEGNEFVPYFAQAVAQFNAGSDPMRSVSLLFESRGNTQATVVSTPLGVRSQYNQILTGILQSYVGEQVPVFYGLSTQASVYSPSPYPRILDYALADFGNTGLFYLDSQTSGVTLISESGHNYASPTPVPTPALLPGLLGLGASIWRKRKQMANEAESCC
jgi:hypothetical protein